MIVRFLSLDSIQKRIDDSNTEVRPIDFLPDDDSDTQLKELKKYYNDLKDIHGSNYINKYGWAVKALGKGDPSIEDIELNVGFDIYRLFYRMACHNIHAGVKGILFREENFFHSISSENL